MSQIDDVVSGAPKRTELIDSHELRELSRRSWAPGLLRLAVHLAIYAALVLTPMFVDSWWVRVPAWLAAGFVLAGLHSVLHYCCHGSFLPTPGGNRMLGRIAGSVVLMNNALYRAFHLRHHRLTGTAGDPEPDGTFASLRQFFTALPNVDYLVAFGRLSFASLLHRYPDFVRTERERTAVRRDSLVLAGWLLATVVLTVLWPWVLLSVYLAPLLVAGSVNFLSALPEHYRAEPTADPLRNTNSVYTRSRWFKFLYWNSNYHAEHHLFPGIPPWRLPEIAGRVRPHLAYTETSYLRFHTTLLAELASGRAAQQQRPVGEGRRADFWYPLDKIEPRKQEASAGDE